MLQKTYFYEELFVVLQYLKTITVDRVKPCDKHMYTVKDLTFILVLVCCATI